MKKLSGIQTGVSGEYFAAAELSRRGFLCSVTLKNTRGIDILVSNQQSSKLVGVQVKTNRKSKKRMGP
jgi:Holliday junction resolvase-like predicted endonuclease